MACSVTIVERRQYLYVTVTGDNTFDTLKTYTTEIPEACIKLKKMRALVVVRLSGPELSMLDVYKGVAAGSDGATGLGMRVAYVDEDDTHSSDAMLLSEDVARGRGIPVRTFRDVTTAEKWLLSDDNF